MEIKKYNARLRKISYFKIVDGDKLFHNEIGPAIITYNRWAKTKTLEYCINNNYYRDNDKPAYILYNNVTGVIMNEQYYDVNGYLHRECKPANILRNDAGIIIEESYFRHGKMHNDNKPACITYTNEGIIKREEYYNNGEFHNENGPAIISYYEDDTGETRTMERFYVNGKFYLAMKYDRQGNCLHKIYKHKMFGIERQIKITLEKNNVLINGKIFDLNVFNKKNINRTLARIKKESTLLQYKYISKHYYDSNKIDEDTFNHIQETIDSKLMLLELF